MVYLLVLRVNTVCKQKGVLIFIVVCDSWDTELNPGPTSLGSSHIPSPVLAGMTGLLSVTHVMCGTTLTVRRAWILPCMESKTTRWIGAWHGNASNVACRQNSQPLYLIQWARLIVAIALIPCQFLTVQSLQILGYQQQRLPKLVYNILDLRQPRGLSLIIRFES